MTSGIADVSDTTLERLRHGIAAGHVRTPLTRSSLTAFGIREQLDPLLATLAGHAKGACISLLTAVLAERAKHDRPAPELVWTGPESGTAVARDTAVVLRELFEGARERVVLAGYTFSNAHGVLQPLHHAMRDRGVEVTFFVEVPQLRAPHDDPPAYAQAELRSFMQTNWPFGLPKPRLYCDRRCLRPGPPWSILHAKCVVADSARAFLSSANFTKSGQNHNIEAGVLLHDAIFSSQLERQLLGLVEADLVVAHGG